MLKKIFIILMMLFFAGCVSLTEEEQETFQELKSYGADYSAFAPKNVFISAFNIFGLGNFYLGYGEDGEESQSSLGATNAYLTLLIFPLIWAIPEAIIDTFTINQRAMINYYKFDPKGIEEYTAFQRKYLAE